jgi:hypothetical protein
MSGSEDSDSSCCSGSARDMATGVKGSDVYTSAGVGDARVALSTQLVRGAAPAAIAAAVATLCKGREEHLTDAVVMAFHARDVRGGKGERDLFRAMLRGVHEAKPSLAEALLDLVPEYGSWDDMFKLADDAPPLKPAVFVTAKAQLLADEAKILSAATEATPSISLLAKWAPREGKEGAALARDFAHFLFGAEKGKHSAAMADYRRRLSKLNAHIKTVETFECARRWDEIEPARVPARARELKKAAYLNEKLGRKKGLEPVLRAPDDPKRMACREHFQGFFAAAAEGKVKISGADTLYPHELVKKATMLLRRDSLTDDEANSMDAVWTQMVAKASAGGGLGSSLFMCDFSGSMESSGVTGDTPYWVSAAMGLLGSSVAAPPFQNRFMTFDAKPQWYVLPPEATTLSAKLRHIAQTARLGQGTSTDFQAAGEEIIKQLKAARAPPGAAPKNLIVVTDMGFDQACSSADTSYYTGSTYRHNVKTAGRQTHAQMLKEAFRRASEDVHGDPAAWPAPRIVIWNVAAKYSHNHQARADEEGVLTLSGWSPSLFKVLCEEGPRAVTPLEVLRLQLDNPRYDPVRQRVTEWLEGGWRGVI